MNRRDFLKSMVGAGVAPCALGLGGLLVPAREIQLIKVELDIPDRSLELVENDKIIVPDDFLVMQARDVKWIKEQLALGVVGWRIHNKYILVPDYFTHKERAVFFSYGKELSS